MRRLIAMVIVSGFLSFILSGEVLALSDNEVNSQHIAEADGISGQNADTGSGVKTNHIQDDAVTAGKIANGAVTSGKIATGAVGTNNIASDAVTANKIGFYGKVVVVALEGGDYTDPVTAMDNHPAWCGSLSETTPCLLKIMPGVYNIGSNCVRMQSYIDIEGSGENTTVIIGNGNSPAVVCGADHAEIRFLKVESTGGGSDSIAIANDDASPKITNVTAYATGGSNRNVGINNHSSSSPIISGVSTSASGGSYSYGVNNELSSSPAMMNVSAIGENGGLENYGVSNSSSSSPTMVNVMASATGDSGSMNRGVGNNSSSPFMSGMTTTASGGNLSVGVENVSSSPFMSNVKANAWGADTNIGVGNDKSSSPDMTNVIAVANGGTMSIGVSNRASSPSMNHVRAVAKKGTKTNIGVYNGTSGTVKIDHSVIIGATRTIYNDAGVTTRVGNTKLDGKAKYNKGTLTCAGVYDENYTFYAGPDCP